MFRFKRSLAAALSLSMILAAATPVFAENTAQTVTAATSTETTASTDGAAVKIPKNGLVTVNGKLNYYKNGKLVKDKLGIKIKKKYYKIDKKGVATRVSEAEGLAGIRLEKCGRDLRKAFNWSSTKITYFGNCGKPRKGQKEVEYYATYGFKYGKGDCYVMAATFCMMAKVKGYSRVYFVKGSVPQANGTNGAHGWCEIKTKGKIYVFDPNFAYTYRNNPNVNSGYMFRYGTPKTYKYNKERTKARV